VKLAKKVRGYQPLNHHHTQENPPKGNGMSSTGQHPGSTTLQSRKEKTPSLELPPTGPSNRNKQTQIYVKTIYKQNSPPDLWYIQKTHAQKPTQPTGNVTDNTTRVAKDSAKAPRARGLDTKTRIQGPGQQQGTNKTAGQQQDNSRTTKRLHQNFRAAIKKLFLSPQEPATDYS
jgi:hypothetical protein